jgi:hypothetical protein
MKHEPWEAFLRGSICLPDIGWSIDMEDELSSKKSLKTARQKQKL